MNSIKALLMIGSFYLFQRLWELWLSRRNARILEQQYGAKLADPSDSIRMKLLHSTWFICWFIEAFIRNQRLENPLFSAILLVLLLGQWIRLQTVIELDVFWTVDLYRIHPRPVINRGIYRFLRHPNYLVVVIELLGAPLLFHAYYTATFFFFLNLFVLKKRIRLEESLLNQDGNYDEAFKQEKLLGLF